MKVLSFVISSALVLSGGLSVAFAQHSGGHSSSGHMAASVHAHSAPSATTFSTLSNHYPSAGQLVYPTPIGLQPQYSGYTGINRGVLPTGNSRLAGRGGYGYRGGYYFPLYYSTFGDYDTPYVYNSSAQDPGTQTSEVTANLLGQQIAQLSAEVDALRSERAAAANQYPARLPYNAPPAMQDDQTPSPAITLVLNNGKKLDVKNYAVMGTDIWDFSTQPAKRISLSSINIGASKTASEANGAEFPSLP